MATNYPFQAVYTKLGIATVPSVAPTLKVVDASDNLLLNGVAVTASANIPGLYTYVYNGADGLRLFGLFHTTDATMDEQDLVSYTPDALTIIKGKTDQFVFTIANQVDANAKTVSYGPGAAAYTITVNDPGGIPIDGVNVWITTDIAGVNVIFNGYTNALGIVSPMLDAGNYYAWKQKAGYTFTNPQLFTAP